MCRKAAVLHHSETWQAYKELVAFFKLFPDYLNHFSIVESRGNSVLVVGHSTCADDRLAGPAIWTAKVENDLGAEWRVYLDTPENRDRLELSAIKQDKC